MPRLWWHVFVPMVVLTSLAVGSRAQVQSNLSGLSGLRVGDYTDQLSNGTSLPLYTLIWRAIGRSFFDPNIVNQTFATDANTAFLEARHSMTYTVANIKWSVFLINTTRTLDRNTGGQASCKRAMLSSVLASSLVSVCWVCSGGVDNRFEFNRVQQY